MSKVTDRALSLLHKKIDEELFANNNSVLDGACEDYAEYRYRCGVIHGLKLAERELLDINNQLERE